MQKKKKKNTESTNPVVSKTTNGKTMILSQCAACDAKKSKFIKEQEGKGLLNNLGIRTPLSKIPLLGDDILFQNYKMNKFLLAGDKFIPEMQLRQPEFSYSACGQFPKNKERIQKFKETRDSRYNYRNQLDKACFQHDMAGGDFKDLARRTAGDKVLRDKAFNIAKDTKYDGYKRGLASMVYKFFDKMTAGRGVKSVPENEELKPIIKKFRKRRVYATFKDNIWGAELADMQLISKFSKGFRFLLCVTDIFSKYAWVVSLKDMHFKVF